jgi:hypothetical protein
MVCPFPPAPSCSSCSRRSVLVSTRQKTKLCVSSASYRATSNIVGLHSSFQLPSQGPEGSPETHPGHQSSSRKLLVQRFLLLLVPVSDSGTDGWPLAVPLAIGKEMMRLYNYHLVQRGSTSCFLTLMGNDPLVYSTLVGRESREGAWEVVAIGWLLTSRLCCALIACSCMM